MKNIPHPRFVGFATILVAGLAALLSIGTSLPIALVASFDVAALSFIVASIGPWRASADIDEMGKRSKRDHAWRIPLLLMSSAIVMAILISIVAILHDRSRLGWPAELLAVVTEIVAWLFANLVYAYHYARLYFDADEATAMHGGIELPGGRSPDFADFVNFAFVLGMTCQTADIGITSGHIRRVTTFHGVAAFFFNLGVLAITVNLIAGAM